MNQMKPNVSIIMPSLNMGPYIKKCLESVVNQTLRSIEIICVDAGSTDETASIINEFALKDSRIKLIRSDVRSYGYQMNLGLEAARGEYIGIVETDDWIEPEMFETLLRTARKDGLDVVKSDFWYSWTKPKEKNVLFKLPRLFISMGVISPMESFENFTDQAEFFNIQPSIWSSLYRKDFLDSHEIRFNETPGASFQDASFNFKVWSCARKVRLIKETFYHYRQDNEGASVNSPGKVYCVCDEYREMEAFAWEHFTGRALTMLQGIKELLKFDSYMWNYGRLSPKLGREFILNVAEEIRDDVNSGRAQKDYFPAFKWNMLIKWADDPKGFLAECEGSREPGFIQRVIRKIKHMLEK